MGILNVVVSMFGKHFFYSFGGAVMVLAMVCIPASAFALDPLTLILLRVVRDKVLSTGLETAVERVPSPSVQHVPQTNLPLGLNDGQLKRLIDEGFVHLSSSQRSEVYDSVRRILLDPTNAADAPGIVADLAVKAAAVLQALESLSGLSTDRKREIAREAGEEYAKMPLDTRDELTEVLRQRIMPLPSDLNGMILSEIDRVRLTLPPAVPAERQPVPDAPMVAPQPR